MPELPDIVVYIQQLEPRILNSRLEKIRLTSPFLLRSATPAIHEAEGKKVQEVRRVGKRVVVGLEDDLFLIFHLMISGRFRWRERGTKALGKTSLVSFEFSSGTLLLTEAGSKKRASLYLVRGEQAVQSHDPGGIDVLSSDLSTFRTRLLRENHTLKRALTDPKLFSGIGNAYSDEILFQARLSPVKSVSKLTESEILALYTSCQQTLREWTARLRSEVGDKFPENVSAFHKEMAVHGRYRLPCLNCGSPIQRIVYAENESNYCPRCQTSGKLLADRALSRLLKSDWPRTLEELEAKKRSSLL
jgi:formamidopyrimidine-DNA glycosylase